MKISEKGTSEKRSWQRWRGHLRDKATGLVKNSRPLKKGENEKGAVWKKVLTAVAMVAEGRGWMNTTRTYIAGSGLKAETDEACHD